MRDAIGPDQAHLHRSPRGVGGEAILVQHHVALQAEPRNGRAARGDGGAGGVEFLLGAVQRRVGLAPVREPLGPFGHVVAGDGGAEAFLEIAPPGLAVGQDREPDRFLFTDNVADRGVLRRAQLVVADLVAGMALERLQQGFRRDEVSGLIDPKSVEVAFGSHRSWLPFLGPRLKPVRGCNETCGSPSLND